jgi:monofunctional biosynthetic peptidoglycan transglycosylase
VLSEPEYQAALAQPPNIGRLQRKVDESIQKEAVFTNTSSAQQPAETAPAPDQPPPPETEHPANSAPPAKNEAVPAASPGETAPENK